MEEESVAIICDVCKGLVATGNRRSVAKKYGQVFVGYWDSKESREGERNTHRRKDFGQVCFPCCEKIFKFIGSMEKEYERCSSV